MLYEMFPEQHEDIDDLLKEGRDCRDVVDIMLEGRITCILRKAAGRVLENHPIATLTTARSCIWNQARVFYKRGQADPSILRSNNFAVSFGGEESVDGGTLRNEFFIYTLRHLNENTLREV